MSCPTGQPFGASRIWSCPTAFRPTIRSSAAARSRPAIDFFGYCRDAFDFLYREGAAQPKMLSIGLHMRIIGHPARAAGLERLLDHVGRFPGVWVARRIDIARHWAANHPPA